MIGRRAKKLNGLAETSAYWVRCTGSTTCSRSRTARTEEKVETR
jgi:hypothetical protein